MSNRAMAWAWEVPGLDHRELLVLLCLADHANEEDICWPSMPYIARRTRTHRATVARVLDRLIDRGAITKTIPGGGHKSNRYRLMLLQPVRLPPEPMPDFDDHPRRTAADPSHSATPSYPHPSHGATADPSHCATPPSHGATAAVAPDATAAVAPDATAAVAPDATRTLMNPHQPSALAHDSGSLPIEPPTPERFKLAPDAIEHGMAMLARVRSQLPGATTTATDAPRGTR